MMRLTGVVGILTLVLGCTQKSNEESGVVPALATPAAFNAAGAPTFAFSVKNMMCEESCVPAVRETLAAQPGVKEVKVELATKTATVAIDESEFDADAAMAALVDQQFEVAKLAAAGDDAAPIDESAAAGKTPKG